jgi:hypothetical protein
VFIEKEIEKIQNLNYAEMKLSSGFRSCGCSEEKGFLSSFSLSE